MPYTDGEKKGRYVFGIYRGIVVDRNDDGSVSGNPHRGRVQVRLEHLQDDDGSPFHFWADYCGPSHQFFSVPAVGTMVMVAFNGGDIHQPVWLGAVNTNNASKDPPSRFKRDEPDVSGYESLQGHFLEFDDISGERHIRLEDINGNYFLMDTELNDLEVFFANDERRTIGRDRTTSIGRDNTTTIGRDETEDIGRDQTETIGQNRTITVEQNDTLTVTSGDKLIEVLTGKWDNTIEQEYTLTGQSFFKGDFQDRVEWTTQDKYTIDAQDNLEFTIQGMWTAEINDAVEWTFSSSWTVEVTDAIEITTQDSVTVEALQDVTVKNALFEFNMQGATMSEWSAGPTTKITLTPASIVLTVGGAVWTLTSAGVTAAVSTYTIAGIDAITHKHLTFGMGPFTSTWVAGP